MKYILAIWPPLLIAAVGAVLLFVTWVGFVVLFFGIADAKGRLADFQYLRRRYLTPRLIGFYGQSYCGRAVVVACNREAATYYKDVGYKWWHVLPDNFPSVLINKNFWRNLFLGHRK